jgi:hypothetical protein
MKTIRKLAVLMIVLMVGVCGSVWADGEPGYNGVISDTTASAGIAAAALYTTGSQGRGIPAKEMWVIVETAAVNFTIDGTTPTTLATTNVGFAMNAGENTVLRGIKAISNFKCINRVASSGAIVKYFILY